MNSVINKRRSILNKIVVGYENIEPCIITGLALRRNIFLEAPHGVGKTSLGKVLGRVADDTGRGFVFYPADKAGLIDIGGLPDMAKTERLGKLSFSASDISIFGKKVIVCDELPRADKERQNYWLEILEERSFRGIKLDYDIVIATGNTSTYKGNFKMDLALKSRFMFWLPVRDFKDIESQEVIEMINLNLDGRPQLDEVANDLKNIIAHIRTKVEEYRKNKPLIEQLSTFVGTFIQFMQQKIRSDHELDANVDAFISPREFADQMPLAIMGLAAYFNYLGLNDVFKLAGEYVIKYTIESRHAGAGEKFINASRMAWRQLRGMLVDGIDTPIGQLQWKFASAISATQKVGFWRDNVIDAVRLFSDGELTNYAGDTLQQIQRENVGQIGPFWHVMKTEQKTKHISAQIEGYMITEVARKLLAGKVTPSTNIGSVYTKYGSVSTLTPENVSEILGVV